LLENHFAVYPKRVPRSLIVPKTSLYHNLLVTAQRYPDKTAIYYYGRDIPYQSLLADVDALAGYLQSELGVQRGERVMLYMQNSPQFVIAFYAIVRVGAAVVPLNPMNLSEELAFFTADSGAQVAFVGQELMDRVSPLLDEKLLERVVVAAYSDYLPSAAPYDLPDFVRASAVASANPRVTLWQAALSRNCPLGPDTATTGDVAVMPYTSGTTGRPKGCIHTHATVQASIAGAATWYQMTAGGVGLATLPLFHVTGLQHSMNASIYSGGTIVLMTRWNREVAASLIQNTKCTHWSNIATMLIDFLAQPDLAQFDLSSLMVVGGGGAALPEAVGEQLFQRTGVRYTEGYGLSETISHTHLNPPDHAKLQCMGVPAFDVDARIVNPQTLEELGPHEEGEVIVAGPQVFTGYWNRPEENEKSFVVLDDKTYFRTGDIAKYDDDGYFFMVDRVKRMINASGFKVWPTEVETILYKHPAVQQACVIGVADERRGETVQAFVVLKANAAESLTENDIVEWSKTQMSAYKYPRIVAFVDRLPMSATGKVLWRQLQEEETARVANAK